MSEITEKEKKLKRIINQKPKILIFHEFYKLQVEKSKTIDFQYSEIFHNQINLLIWINISVMKLKESIILQVIQQSRLKVSNHFEFQTILKMNGLMKVQN